MQGIPTLVVLDENAKIITTDARGKVMQDPAASGFPWAPKAFWDIFGDQPLQKHGNDAGVKIADVRAQADVIGLYFSASWCGPCRAFTPKLKETYQKLNGKFEVVLCPGDRDHESWTQYWAEQPWLSFEFGTRSTARSVLPFFLTLSHR